MNPVPISTLLPPEARALLVRASQVQGSAANPGARTKAIEKAIQRVKEKFPQHFQE